jgi:hypothetical protein
MYTPSRNVLFEKFSRDKASEEFFIQFIDGCEIFSMLKTDMIFFVKNDRGFMSYNRKDKNVGIDYYLITTVLMDKYGYNIEELLALFKILVHRYFSLDKVKIEQTGLNAIARSWRTTRKKTILKSKCFAPDKVCLIVQK